MARPTYPSDEIDRLMLRMPAGLRERIAKQAKRNGHSMNTAIVHALEIAFPPQPKLSDMIEYLEMVVTGVKEEKPRFAIRRIQQAMDELKETYEAENEP